VTKAKGRHTDSRRLRSGSLRAIRRTKRTVAISEQRMATSGTREIRQCFPTRPVIIGITGEYTKGADRISAEMSGFDYYLVKPADPNVLMALLQKISTSPRLVPPAASPGSR
jgi:DNA-binding response OmpR family regulator